MIFADARLGDTGDVGQLLEERHREAAVRRAAAAVTGTGASECQRYGEPIEPARLAAFPAAVRCIDCQTCFEKGPR